MNGLETQPRVHLGTTRITTTGIAVASSGLARNAAGSYTVGNRFCLAMAARLVGVRCAWKLANEATPETVTVKAWDANGTLLEAVTTTVSASGAQAVNLVQSYAIAAWSLFTVTTYQSSSGKYVASTLAGAPSGVKLPDFAGAYAANTGAGAAVPLGGGVLFIDGCYTATAVDAVPNTRNNPGAQWLGVDPILDID